MSTPYIGEVRMFGGNFAPSQWALCNGQLLPISTNETLYTLLGTTFGGDGTQTFALPNLRGRLPVGMGNGVGLTPRVLGQSAGSEGVTITTQTMAAHGHPVYAAQAAANSTTISSTVLPATAPTGGDFYVINAGTPPTLGMMAPPTVVGNSGGSTPHNNMMPYLCVTFIIALYGVYPSFN